MVSFDDKMSFGEFYNKKKDFNDFLYFGIDYARMLLFVFGVLVYWKSH